MRYALAVLLFLCVEKKKCLIMLSIVKISKILFLFGSQIYIVDRRARGWSHGDTRCARTHTTR